MLGQLWMHTLMSGIANGVGLKLKMLRILLYAEMARLICDGQSKLMVIIVWGMRRSHLFLGNEGLALACVDSKYDLQV